MKTLSIEDITLNDVVYYFPFCVWLNENGWQNYVDNEMWICCSEGNKVRHIKELFEEFKKETI